MRSRGFRGISPFAISLVYHVPLNCRQRALGVAKWRNHVHKQMGPRRTHTLADEPFNYWASVVSHVVVTLVLSALAAGAFWLAHLEGLGNKASKQPSVKP